MQQRSNLLPVHLIQKKEPVTLDTGIIEGNLYKTVGIQYDGFEIIRVNGEITINKQATFCYKKRA